VTAVLMGEITSKKSADPHIQKKENGEGKGKPNPTELGLSKSTCINRKRKVDFARQKERNTQGKGSTAALGKKRGKEVKRQEKSKGH